MYFFLTFGIVIVFSTIRFLSAEALNEGGQPNPDVKTGLQLQDYEQDTTYMFLATYDD